MAQLYWSDELLTGVQDIDNQHREVFEQITRFLQDCEKGKGRASIEHTLSYFENYVRFHFEAEEKLQQATGYPHVRAHQGHHALLLDKLNELKASLAHGGITLGLSMKAMQFWADWFVHHIAKEDKAVADFLRAKGLSPVHVAGGRVKT